MILNSYLNFLQKKKTFFKLKIAIFIYASIYIAL